MKVNTHKTIKLNKVGNRVYDKFVNAVLRLGLGSDLFVKISRPGAGPDLGRPEPPDLGGAQPFWGSHLH